VFFGSRCPNELWRKSECEVVVNVGDADGGDCFQWLQQSDWAVVGRKSDYSWERKGKKKRDETQLRKKRIRETKLNSAEKERHSHRRTLPSSLTHPPSSTRTKRFVPSLAQDRTKYKGQINRHTHTHTYTHTHTHAHTHAHTHVHARRQECVKCARGLMRSRKLFKDRKNFSKTGFNTRTRDSTPLSSVL